MTALLDRLAFVAMDHPGVIAAVLLGGAVMFGIVLELAAAGPAHTHDEGERRPGQRCDACEAGR